MAAYIYSETKLSDTLTVATGVEITCPSLADPRVNRGVITSAYIGEYWPKSGGVQDAFYINIEYGSFREKRRIDDKGNVI